MMFSDNFMVFSKGPNISEIWQKVNGYPLSSAVALWIKEI